MIRNWVRRWLGIDPSSVESAPLRGDNLDGLTHVATGQGMEYDPDSYYFAIKRVDNGWVMTMRTFPEKNPLVNNAHGRGPGFSDRVRIVSAEEDLLTTIGGILIAERMK